MNVAPTPEPRRDPVGAPLVTPGAHRARHGRGHPADEPPPRTRRGATCDARPTVGRQHDRPPRVCDCPRPPRVCPQSRRHECRPTPEPPPRTRGGATCDARPTAGRQHDRPPCVCVRMCMRLFPFNPRVCVRHPGDMNVAPTALPYGLALRLCPTALPYGLALRSCLFRNV